MPDRLPDVRTIHQAQLDAFTTDLIRKGFRPSAAPPGWIGPIHPCLANFTAAGEMRIEIRDGWPYRHPHLFAEGLRGRRHVSGTDNVCLWDEADDSYEWLTFAGIQRRINAWCADQARSSSEPTLDSHLYFEPFDRNLLVIVDLEALAHSRALPVADGSPTITRARRDGPIYRVDGRGDVQAALFRVAELVAPPSDWEALRAMLSPAQRADLTRFTLWAGTRRAALIILLWRQADVPGALAVHFRRPRSGTAHIHALEIAVTSSEIMKLRAGPDAAMVEGKKIVLFGVGAIGSHLVTLLAKSGLGAMLMLDEERLRPGDLTRHAASGKFVGQSKSNAITRTLREAMVMTQMTDGYGSVWDVERLSELAQSHHLLIDATGNPAYTDLVSRVSAEIQPTVPVLSIALYRGGRIARARVQVVADAPIVARGESSAFPEIPPDPEGEGAAFGWEPGCGSPVNNAPPWAVAAAASLATRVAIRILAGSLLQDQDIVEIYEPLEVAPFDRQGPCVFPLTDDM